MAEPTYSPQNKEDVKVLLQKHNGENEEKWPFFRRIGEKTQSRWNLEQRSQPQ